MIIVFIQLHIREKDVATLSVCIRVKKNDGPKKSPIHESAGFYQKSVKN
jgi:hypothetical protein